MKTNEKDNVVVKHKYSAPVIKSIRIDNQISMVMMSPPGEPGASLTPMKEDPFKINKA
jgi:secreted Zn-dependent insulinase-like peptidase